MSYQFYKIMHLLGLMTLFFGFGGLLISKYSGVLLSKKARIMSMATHGLGLLLILVGGFGMAAKLGIMGGMPNWMNAKIGIWVLLAVAISLVKRKGQIGWPVAILLLGLGTTAAFIAVNKPF